jgi:heme a synthase
MNFMPVPGLHRFSVVLAVCALLLVVAGAVIASQQAGTAPTQGPLQQVHQAIGAMVGILTIVLLVWIWKAGEAGWMKKLGVAAVLAVAIQGAIGATAVGNQLPKALVVIHACLAQVFFAATAAIALFTSPAWRTPSRVVDDGGTPSLRSLAWATPAALLAQVLLGAAYRYGVFGAVPHVTWALVATMIAVMTSSFVLSQFPQHAPLRKASWRLIGLICAQIVLGIAALAARIAADQGAASDWTVLLRVAHVGTGALVMAAAVVLSLWILRDVRSVKLSHELARTGRAS